MTEPIAFEDRFAEQLRAYAGPASRPPRPEAVANAVEAARNVRGAVPGELRWPRLGRLSMAVAAVAAAVVVAVVAVEILGSLPNQPSVGVPAVTQTPTPTVTPTPTSDPRSPTPTAQSSTSDSMWPQKSHEEVLQAQELADAGDPRYTWQVDPKLYDAAAPWGAEILDRFPREALGWEQFRTGEQFGFAKGGRTFFELVLFRCAPGRTNLLYPDDAQVGSCAPTIDESRYETVMLTLEQPGRRDPTGIWEVTEWMMLPPSEPSSPVDHLHANVDLGQVEQVAPPSDAEADALLQAFLGARVAGEGAEQYVHMHPGEAREVRFEGPRDGEVALLYATSAGAAYERYEIDRVQGPVWPTGHIEFRIRLFAADGTVVEQGLSVVRQEDGRVGIVYGSQENVPGTTENGQVAPIPYRFLDGEVTFAAASPWNTLDYSPPALYNANPQQGNRLDMVADPLTVSAGCQPGPAPANAEALVRSIRSDANLVATVPVAATVGGLDALRIDVVAAPGAIDCGDGDTGPLVLTERESSAWRLDGANRMRLYVLDLPGGSARVLVIAIVASESEMDRVADEATPVLDSIEFHLP
jgi:hypothetical protein